MRPPPHRPPPTPGFLRGQQLAHQRRQHARAEVRVCVLDDAYVVCVYTCTCVFCRVLFGAYAGLCARSVCVYICTCVSCGDLSGAYVARVLPDARSSACVRRRRDAAATSIPSSPPCCPPPPTTHTRRPQPAHPPHPLLCCRWRCRWYATPAVMPDGKVRGRGRGRVWVCACACVCVCVCVPFTPSRLRPNLLCALWAASGSWFLCDSKNYPHPHPHSYPHPQSLTLTPPSPQPHPHPYPHTPCRCSSRAAVRSTTPARRRPGRSCGTPRSPGPRRAPWHSRRRSSRWSTAGTRCYGCCRGVRGWADRGADRDGEGGVCGEEGRMWMIGERHGVVGFESELGVARGGKGNVEVSHFTKAATSKHTGEHSPARPPPRPPRRRVLVGGPRGRHHRQRHVPGAAQRAQVPRQLQVRALGCLGVCEGVCVCVC